MSNQKNNMSEETRRSFIKSSVSKTLVAANTSIIAGLINTPGLLHADGTTGSGTTVPETTVAGCKSVYWAWTETVSLDHDEFATESDAQAYADTIAQGINNNTTGLATTQNQTGPTEYGNRYACWTWRWVFKNTCSTPTVVQDIYHPHTWTIAYTITSKKTKEYFQPLP